MADFVNTVDVLGDDAVIDSIIDRTITEFKDNVITETGVGAFYDCTMLANVDVPNVTNMHAWSFMNCTSLTSINAPKVTTFSDWDGSQFQGCTALKTASFPALTAVSRGCFKGCTSLESINVPAVTKLDVASFHNCSSLTEIDLPEALNTGGLQSFEGCSNLSRISCPKVETLSGSFRGCAFTTIDLPSVKKIEGSVFFYNNKIKHIVLRNTGVVCTLGGKLDGGHQNTADYIKTVNIYVPSALIEDYKVATNWIIYADQFRALEDYTVDGTTTGELDETKI